ncbi:MAG: HD domain-containing protein, partial [Ferroplasma sp.]
SIGTMHMARQLSNTLGIDDSMPAIGGLLHDIGHMPFSHAIEETFFRYYKLTHEDLTKKIIMGEKPYEDSTVPDILRKYGYNPLDVAEIATGQSKKYKLYSAMISGPIDVDELDYLRRDAFYCGVTMGQIDYMRLFNTVMVSNGSIVGEEKSIPTLESTIITRILMFNSVYFHKTCRVAQKMLGIAYDMYNDRSVEDLKLRDCQFLEKLNSGISGQITSKILNRRLYKVIHRENYSKTSLESAKKTLSAFNDYDYIIDIIPPLYFSGRERIKNYIDVNYRGKIRRIDAVSSLARSLYEEIENRRIIISANTEVIGENQDFSSK